MKRSFSWKSVDITMMQEDKICTCATHIPLSKMTKQWRSHCSIPLHYVVNYIYTYNLWSSLEHVPVLLTWSWCVRLFWPAVPAPESSPSPWPLHLAPLHPVDAPSPPSSSCGKDWGSDSNTVYKVGRVQVTDSSVNHTQALNE